MYYNQISDKPCAYITKNKQRVKQFGQNVYLKDGSEFELELYNSSRKTVLSKIKINGEFIKGGGIILRPGERVFLERYIDVARKFKFETYNVDSTNETMNAIANNGDVEILFYEETEVVVGNSIPTYGGTYYYNTLTAPIGGNLYTSNVNYSSNVGDLGVSLTNSLGTLNLTSSNLKRKKTTKSIETGRVEQGSNSNQTFKTVNKDFNSWTVSVSIWKILPESQRPIEKKDLIERCPRCSTKIKKSSWKFCPECGNEIKQETFEEQLNKLSKEELIELLKNK
jgi:hypothetical protein